MGSLLSLSLPAAPPGDSKATQTEWNCPVCHTVHSDTAAVPCGHQFCLGCLLRHSASSPACPQCGSPVLSARFSAAGSSDALQCILTPGGQPPQPHSWARRALFHLVYTRPPPATPATPAAPAAPATPAAPRPEPAERFPAELWAELLHGREQLLDPVRPWLRQSLDAIYGPQWWEARQVESIALSTLCICGPDREGLTHMLQGYLGEYTAPLIHGLIHVTVRRCRDAWLQRRAQAAPEEQQGESPGEPEAAPPEQYQSRAWLEQHQPWAGAEQHQHQHQHQPRAAPQENAPAPGPSAPRQGRSPRPRATRRSQRRRADRCRNPWMVRRRKPRRK